MRSATQQDSNSQAVALRTAGFKKAVAKQCIGRQLLILSPYFPPSTLAGVHRARHLAKHLPAFGWKPVVVCVDEKYHEERLDPDLAALVPKDVETAKVKALPAKLSRRVGIGDIGLRAFKNLRHKLFDLLETRPVAAVLITGAPFYPMLLASEIKRRFDTPVVLDFQDPWVSSWGKNQHMFSKAEIVHQLAKLLEPRALRNANFITSVSAVQNDEMAARYPWLDRSRMAAIPIGGDKDDFNPLARKLRTEKCVHLDQSFINVSYVGTFLPRSGPLVRTLFGAFARLRSAEPELAARIRLNFIGTSNQPNDGSTFRVRPIAEERGIANFVREVPQRIPYLQALEVLAASNGLLLIGSDEPHYTASKIYPALMSGKPFLSVFHCASSAHAVLSAAGGGRARAFSDLSELAALESSLTEDLRTLALNPESFGIPDRNEYRAYEARAVAGQFASILELVSAEKEAKDETIQQSNR